jgi:hypothetical protein
MRIGWIGGLDRNAPQLEVLAKREGHSLDFHNGAVQGRGASEIRSLVHRADLVVIVTGVNSHGAMYLAKRECQRVGREYLVLKHCGTSRFRELLGSLSARAA